MNAFHTKECDPIFNCTGVLKSTNDYLILNQITLPTTLNPSLNTVLTPFMPIVSGTTTPFEWKTWQNYHTWCLITITVTVYQM